LSRLSQLHPARFFSGTWQDIDRRSLEERKKLSSPDRLPLIIYCVAVSSLILQQYMGSKMVFIRAVHRIARWEADSGFTQWAASHAQSIVTSDRFGLWSLGYWALWRVLGFLIIPLVAIAFTPNLKVRDCGVGIKGLKEHLWIYVVLFAIVLPVVVGVSFTDDFSSYYPFYKNSHRSLEEFMIWQLLYAAQFVSLEFFFRGYMLMPLERSMGSGAIFAMLFPYVMIHFGKPMVECFAAILAGIVLGTLAMRTRSIWLGAMIHITVAVTMDLAAIWQVHWR